MPHRSRVPEAPEVDAGAAGGGHEDEAAGCWEVEAEAAADRLAAPDAAEGDAPRFSLSATAL